MKQLCPICGGYGTDRNGNVCTYCAGARFDPYQKDTQGGLTGGGSSTPSLKGFPRIFVLVATLGATYLAYHHARGTGDELPNAGIVFVATMLASALIVKALSKPIATIFLIGGLLAIDAYFLNWNASHWLADALPGVVDFFQGLVGI